MNCFRDKLKSALLTRVPFFMHSIGFSRSVLRDRAERADWGGGGGRVSERVVGGGWRMEGGKCSHKQMVSIELSYG